VSSDAILSVSDLHTEFTTRHGVVRAVDGVSFELKKGETFGIVGESGCGKSTLAKTIMRLIEPQGGTIILDGVDITRLSRRALKPHRRKMQMVFQDPYASLNPRATVGRIILEPLLVNNWGSREQCEQRVAWLMERVGLSKDAAKRHPHEFSGGQRQRIGIARAIALEPKVVVCDEAVSALDVSIRAQIINLLLDLQRDLGIAYVFVSHDLSVAEHIADRIGVMYFGKMVEVADRDQLWTSPLHPYTQGLIAAVPLLDPTLARRRHRRLVIGESPSQLTPPSGCSYHPRCTFAQDWCRVEVPALKKVGANRLVACHLVKDYADGRIEHPSADPPERGEASPRPSGQTAAQGAVVRELRRPS
jgi:oligopeptide/dipeptide ABC transporter ATP-binding protein